MRTNKPAVVTPTFTHEGGQAFAHMTPIQALRRSVLSCLLWEDEFYESGQSIAERIAELCAQVPVSAICALAYEARSKFHLRHVPLLLLTQACKYGSGNALVSKTITETIQRADELAELVAIYWKHNAVKPAKSLQDFALSAKHAPLSKQLRLGLAAAFLKFTEYDFAKYNRKNEVKLRDVLRLCHAKPESPDQAALFKHINEDTLQTPDTWEVALSGGADKKETFERLLAEGKLGYLALLRNLRNMEQVGCDMQLVRNAILARKGAARVLPFRFVAAMRACPRLAQSLDEALCAGLSALPKLSGKTAVLVDVSGSMNDRLSVRSDLTRMDAAAALASVIQAEELRVFSFSGQVQEVPPWRGLAGIEAIRNSQPHSSTRLFEALAAINTVVQYDRLIIITDEQAQGSLRMPNPKGLGYVINVASAKHGVGYGKWTHIDGFSEQVIRFILEIENAAPHGQAG